MGTLRQTIVLNRSYLIRNFAAALVWRGGGGAFDNGEKHILWFTPMCLTSDMSYYETTILFKQ